MIGVEIFAGAGGMAQGAKQTGIDIRIAIESDCNAAKTYLKNHRETSVIIDDIKNIQEFRFRRNGKVILFGGPPCQGYSKSNRKTYSNNNPQNWLFKEFIRVVKLVSPDWIVMENVPNLKRMDSGHFLRMICYELNLIGFTPNVQILNAKDFGVPQNRERLFIVASKNGVAFEFPDIINSKSVTVKEALSDLPILKSGASQSTKRYRKNAESNYAKLLRNKSIFVTENLVTRNSINVLNRYKHIKQGGNWRDIPEYLMKNYKDHSRCHGNIYRRLKLSKPSFIISNYRKSMLVHPTQNRGLSVREAARLQSFPDSYEFSGSLDQKQQQVGNAVPPLLSKAVFDQIKHYN